jgi:hypothetical protein
MQVASGPSDSSAPHSPCRYEESSGPYLQCTVVLLQEGDSIVVCKLCKYRFREYNGLCGLAFFQYMVKLCMVDPWYLWVFGKTSNAQDV